MRYTHTSCCSRPFRRASWRNRSGNAVLDMALVMPVLIYLTFGACEYGYALYVKHSLQAAATKRAGGDRERGGGSGRADGGGQLHAGVRLCTGRSTRPPTITPAGWAASAAGTTVQVTVNTTWGTIGVSLLPSGMGGISSSKALSGSTTMRKEG